MRVEGCSYKLPMAPTVVRIERRQFLATAQTIVGVRSMRGNPVALLVADATPTHVRPDRFEKPRRSRTSIGATGGSARLQLHASTLVRLVNPNVSKLLPTFSDQFPRVFIPFKAVVDNACVRPHKKENWMFSVILSVS
jgi:hypothetical protein